MKYQNLTTLLLVASGMAMAEQHLRAGSAPSANTRAPYASAISQTLDQGKIRAKEKRDPNEKDPPTSKADARTVYIKDVNITGNELYDDQTLRAVVAPKLGKNLNFVQILNLAFDIERYYNNNDYPIVKVFIPHGGIDKNVLTIEVLEGKLGKVSVKGNKRYAEKTLVKVIDSYLERNKIFSIAQAERPLTLLNSYPGLEIASSLSMGDEVGTTNMKLNVKEKPLVTGSIELNNFGSETAGEYRLIPYIALQNPSGLGDMASIFASVALDQLDTWSYQVDYSIPVTSYGTFARAYFSQGNNTAGNEFELLDINGDSLSWGIGVSQQLIYSAKTKLELQAMFDWQYMNQEMLGLQTIEDNIRKLRFGANFEHSDSKGRTYLSLFWHQGLGEFLGGMENDSILSSRAFSEADNSFSKLVFSGMRLQRFNERVYGIFNITAQASLDPLVSSEQIYLGGANSVRGQPYSLDYGDQGVIINAELRYNVREGFPSLQLAAFFDYGVTHTKKPLLYKERTFDAAGAGVGIRSQIYEGWDARVDLAVPVGGRYGDELYVYGQLRYSF